MNLTSDWLYLYIQIGILLIIPLREILRRRERNLFAILIPLTLLILVQGQAWWMLERFSAEQTMDIQHLYQYITVDGFHRANVLSCICTIIMATTYVYFSLRNKRMEPRPVRTLLPPQRPSLHNLFIAVSAALLGFLVIDISGGIEAAVSSPGTTMAHGLVFLLMLLWIGKFPVLNNIAAGRKNNWLELAPFLIVIAVFLFNSRFLVSFILLQLITLYNYSRREVPRRAILAAGSVFFLIFFFFGMYRHYFPQREIMQEDWTSVFAVNFLSVSNLVDWFYSLNIEGFAGLAGLMTYGANQGGISYDFGLSNFSALFQFIPSSLRFSEGLPFLDIKDFFSSLYPYVGSIIPSGPENAYAHFGVAGLLFWGMLLGFMMPWLHRQMLNPANDRLLIALLAVQSLQLIRGSFYLLTFLILSEIIMLAVYRMTCGISQMVTFKWSKEPALTQPQQLLIRKD